MYALESADAPATLKLTIQTCISHNVVFPDTSKALFKVQEPVTCNAPVTDASASVVSPNTVNF